MLRIAILTAAICAAAQGQTLTGTALATNGLRVDVGMTVVEDADSGRAAAIIEIGTTAVALNLTEQKEEGGRRYYTGEATLPDGTEVRASLVTGDGDADASAGVTFASPQVAGVAALRPK